MARKSWDAGLLTVKRKFSKINSIQDLEQGPDIINFSKVQPLEGDNESDPSNSLYRCLRPFLIFGRIIGTLPIQGLFQGDVKALTCRRKDFGAFFNCLVSLSMTFCAIISVITLFESNNKSVPKIVWASNPVIFFFMGFFCYFYLFKYGKELANVLEKWEGLNLSFKLRDKKLKRDSNLIFGLIFLSAILENLLQQLIQLSAFDLSVNATKSPSAGFVNLRGYFEKSTQPAWPSLFDYNPILTILIFVWNKCALYGWNYVDLLIIILCRAFYHQFKNLVGNTQNQLTDHPTGIFDYERWDVVTKDFEKLYSLLADLNKFLSPLLFVSYGVNLFFITIHIHMGLTPVGANNAATNVYRTWSFFQISARLGIITLYAARINDYAEQFAMLLRKCPVPCYSISVRRVEIFIKSTKLGITGLNCFVVTKPFMLNLISVVLTFEIVLLQASGFTYF